MSTRLPRINILQDDGCFALSIWGVQQLLDIAIPVICVFMLYAWLADKALVRLCSWCREDAEYSRMLQPLWLLLH